VPLAAPNYTISQRLLHLMEDSEKTYKLDRVETLSVDVDTSRIPFFVKTLKQIIVFHLSHAQGGSFDIDLSRAVVKMEDMVASLIFDGKINDRNTKYHQHLKLFQSSWPAVSSSNSNSDDDEVETQDFHPNDESQSIPSIHRMI